MPAVSEAEARRVYREMVSEELAFLRANPDERVRPHPFGDECRAGDCDLSTLEAVARRLTERAVERTLRNKNATTEA